MPKTQFATLYKQLLSNAVFQYQSPHRSQTSISNTVSTGDRDQVLLDELLQPLLMVGRSSNLQFQEISQVHHEALSELMHVHGLDNVDLRTAGSFLAQVVSGLNTDVPIVAHVPFLVDSHKLYMLVTENMNDVVLLTTPDSTITYISPSIKLLLGYTAEEMTGQKSINMVVESERDKVNEEVQRLMQSADRFKLSTHCLQTKTGELVWVETVFTVLRDETGKTTGTVMSIRDVNETHAAFKQLERSERRYRALFEQSHDAIFIMDLNGEYLEINQRAAEMMGYTLEGLKVKHAFEITDPAELEDALRRRDALVRGENVPIYKRTFITKDGNRLTTDISLSLVRDDEGNPLHIQSVVRDMTEHSNLLHSLEESQQFIEQITNAVPDVIYLYDVLQQKNVYSNHEITDVLGYTPEEVQQMSLTDLFHPQDIESGVLDPKRYQVFNKGVAVLETEYRARHKSGEWVYLYSRDVPFKRDENGMITQVLGIAQDVTVKRWLEEQLVLNTRAIYASPVGIAIADAREPDFPLIFVNPAFENTTGYTSIEILGKNCRILQGDNTDQPEISIIRRTLKEHGECTVTLRNYTKDGRMFWNQLSLSPIFDEKEQLAYYLGILNDVTPIRMAEIQLAAALEQEQELNRIKTRFVSLASHEFRTPLTIIRSTAETLRDHIDKMNEEQRMRRFKTIDKQIMRLITLLNDVLHLGQIESGKVSFKPEWLDLNQFIAEYVEEFSSAYPSHKIVLNLLETSTPIRTDKNLLLQIINNLFTNAIKYSPDADSIEVSLELAHRSLLFKVRDFGIGIPEKEQRLIFSGFQRASNVGAIKGTGLGLSIVKHAVSVHDWKLSVDSEEGVGTTFCVTVPLEH